MRITFFATPLQTPESLSHHISSWGRTIALISGLLLALLAPAANAALKFAIPPFLPQAEEERAFAPLVQSLSEQVGVPMEIVTFPNFLAFWQATRTGSPFDIALDSAPVSDFRVERQHWHIIAKLNGTVTQSLVTGPKEVVLDPSELINKKIAVQPTPSVSALTLYQLFPNPVQQPILVFKDSNREAAEAVLSGEVDAAIIPTPIAAGYPALNLVTTTKPIPFLAVSVSPNVPPSVVSALQKALVDLDKTPAGQELLKKSQLRAFEVANDHEYAGDSKLLEGTFGY
jgi:phosphonate transport system substrate-binding protein